MINSFEWEAPREIVPQDIQQEARDVADRMAKELTKTQSHRNFYAAQDVQAYIGEWSVKHWLVQHGLKEGEDFEQNPWDPKRIGGDAFDFNFSFNPNAKTDVKTRRFMNHTSETKNLDFEVIIDRRNKGGQAVKKPMDYYIFAGWDERNNACYLLGWATKQSFVQAPSYRHVAPGEEIWPNSGNTKNGKANSDIYLVQIRHLEPMQTFLKEIQA